MTATRRIGQLVRTRKLKLAVPETFAAERLEDWQPYWEDCTLPQARPEVTGCGGNNGTDTTLWIENVLRTTRDLLLASYLPCFEPIRLLRWSRQDPEGGATESICNVEMELPVFEDYSPGTIRTAINEAIICIDFMMARPPSEVNREALWAEIENKSLGRIAKDNRVNLATFRILQTAHQKDIPFTHLGLGVYQLGWGAAANIINRSTSTNDSALSVRLTMFKHVSAQLMRRAGLPAPEHAIVRNQASAQKAAASIGWPLVVKPADLERGEGVATDVQPETLVAAVKRALELSPTNQALVERQVSGVCYRLFVAGGQLLYVVKRNPMGVFGDGKKTIAELVEAECAVQRLKPAWCRSKIRPLDDLARAAIASTGSTETTVPEDQQFVPLRQIESTAWGGTGEEFTDQVHPENIRIAVAATSLCGLTTAGVDILTDDITRPWTETGAIINEVNFSPALGGSDISRKYLPEYVDRLMKGSGRVPVTVFVGDGEAMDAAKAHLQTLRRRGISGYMTSELSTYDADGRELWIASTGVSARVCALLLSREVEAIVVVVQSDDLLDQPLPLDSVDEVVFINQPEVRSETRKQRLVDLLSSWAMTRDQVARQVAKTTLGAGFMSGKPVYDDPVGPNSQ